MCDAKMVRIKLIIICFLWSSSQLDVVRNVQAKEKSESLSYVFTKGDFIIGGLSPVHFSPTEAEEQQNPNSFTCQGRLNTRGFEAVEAMLFTMDMLNEGQLKDLVLPNITIGMDIKDTCGSADYAVRESLNFSFIRNAHVQDHCSPSQPSEKKLQTIAVVGAAYSGVSMAVTNLCGLFYVPVVSYASTSSLLSNKVRFRYFLRTVPNDMLQAKVMADLVREMKWNYVITLASDTEYGRSGIEAFKHALASFGNSYDVCIPVEERFTKRSTDQHFEKIFRQMKANPKARVVIMFAQLHDANILISKFRQHKYMATEKYLWIGSDAWADSKQVLKSNEDILRGMFGVVPEVIHIDEFDKYFTNFNDKRRKRNPWMREYEYLKVAHNPAFYRHTFKHYPKAQYVMDAVLATAYALHDMLGCEPHKDCSSKVTPNLKQQDFRNYLQSVRFAGKSRELFSFDELGDAIGVYDIKHLEFGGGNYEFVKVGKWGWRECDVFGKNASLRSCLDLDLTVMEKLKTSLKNHTKNDIPFSTCSKACSPGFHKNAEKNHAKCCWHCRPCSGNTISNRTNMDDCTPCQRGYWANTNHSRCEPITPTSLHWTDTLGVIIICISGTGVFAVICTFAVYYLYRETPVVRASSKELCYVLLFGIAWCYLTPLVYLADRTDQICRAIPFVTGLCPSLIAGTLLTKTNRISRIFNRKLLKTGTPSCLSKKWQLLMVIFLAVIECLISGGCVFFNDSGSKLLISDDRKEVLKQCKGAPDICTAIWWVYNAGLALTCTYQAFRTRKLPENYNEAKFITFTMVITCIVVTIFIPTYIGTSGIYRTTITCFVFIIGGSSTLCCMFVPKLYIILWRPEKNVPMPPRSSTVRLGTISPSASFVRRLSTVSNGEEGPLETRKKRINSLPAMEMNRMEENDENDQDVPPRCKKTKRSLSLNPYMLSRYQAGPERSPARANRIMSVRRRSSLAGCNYPVSMEMIEEGTEFEQIGSSLNSQLDDAVFDSPKLHRAPGQVKPFVESGVFESSGSSVVYVEGGNDLNYYEKDGLLSSRGDNLVDNDFDSGCEGASTALAGFNEDESSATYTLKINDHLKGETRKGPNHKITTLPDIRCHKCGSNFIKTPYQRELSLKSAFCEHLVKNRSNQKYNNRKLADVQGIQHGDNNRKRKSGAPVKLSKSAEKLLSFRDVNANEPVKRLRNANHHQCKSLSLPSLLSPLLEVEGHPLKLRNNSLEHGKNFNATNVYEATKNTRSCGNVCLCATNGDTKTEKDKLLCNEEIETELL